MSDGYQYRERDVTLDVENEFRFGEGKISAYCSIILGVLSLLAVLAYRYPAYLTTIELRQAYDAEFLQEILKYGMYFSLFFGLLAIFLNKHKRLAVAGVALTLVGFALGGYSIPVGPVDARRLSLGFDWLILAFLGSAGIFMALEKLFPRYRDQIILRKEWELDLFYFCLNHLAISAILIYGNYHVSHFDWAISELIQQAIRSVPVVLQLVLVILSADFVLYWEHRIYHEVSWLWPIHAVHHSVESLDWLAGSRGHFLQTFSERAMVMVPLYLLGVDKTVLDLYVTFAALQAILIHCNLSFSFGILKYVFVTPQFHHWHHSSERPAIDTNYSAHTVLFDRLFNSYHVPDVRWPAEYGTTKKLPKNFLGQILYPVTALIKRK